MRVRWSGSNSVEVAHATTMMRVFLLHVLCAGKFVLQSLCLSVCRSVCLSVSSFIPPRMPQSLIAGRFSFFVNNGVSSRLLLTCLEQMRYYCCTCEPVNGTPLHIHLSEAFLCHLPTRPFTSGAVQEACFASLPCARRLAGNRILSFMDAVVAVSSTGGPSCAGLGEQSGPVAPCLLVLGMWKMISKLCL